MVNAGAAITPDDERKMFELIDGLDDLECLVISGSLPPNASDGFLRGAIERVRARGAELVLDISSCQLAEVLDISSCQLAELLELEPLLIKPNDDELRDIFGLDVHAGDDASVVAAMTELHARGAKNVLLTLGGAGAYFSNGERLWFARRAFEVKVRSTVCAGDSSLAAFLSIWSSERDRVEDARAPRSARETPRSPRSCPSGPPSATAWRMRSAAPWRPAPTWSSAPAWATSPALGNTRRASRSAW